MSDRLTKWAIDMSEFDITCTLKMLIKGQVVVDFVAEFIEPDAEVAKMVEEMERKSYQWHLYVDKSSNMHGNGHGL